MKKTPVTEVTGAELRDIAHRIVGIFKLILPNGSSTQAVGVTHRLRQARRMVAVLEVRNSIFENRRVAERDPCAAVSLQSLMTYSGFV